MELLKDNIKFLYINIRVILYVFCKRYAKGDLSRDITLDDKIYKFLDYTLDNFVSRFAISYFVVLSKSVKKRRTIGLSLLIGYVSAVDDLIDEGGFASGGEYKDLFNRIDKEEILGDQTLLEFRNIVYSFFESSKQKELDQFFAELKEYESNFRDEYTKELGSNKFLSHDVVYEYREGTTIRYIKFLRDLSNFSKSVYEALVPGTWLIQYMDDMMDARKDYENNDVNLFISILAEKGELDSYLSGGKYTNSRKQINKIMHEYVDTFNFHGRLVYKIVLFIFNIIY